MRSFECIETRSYIATVSELAKTAPNMALISADKIAKKLSVAEGEVYRLKCALAVLAVPLGFSSNGARPDSLNETDAATSWALDQVMHCHAWVVCGPVADGIGKLKKEIELENWANK